MNKAKNKADTNTDNHRKDDKPPYRQHNTTDGHHLHQNLKYFLLKIT
jgi:hypothetical protein